MIATRFRTVGLVAAVAVAAIGCYMVSLRVAAERAELTRLERRILSTKQDIRALQTEMGTRARLSQLERWNVDVLALASPKSGQYLKGELQLASLVEPPKPLAPIRIETPAGPKVIPVAYEPAAPNRDAEPKRAAEPPRPEPLLRRANYIKPAADERPEIKQVALLDDKLLGEIGRAAKGEARKTRQQ